MNESTIDRLLQEARKTFGPDHEVFLSELGAFLKNSDDTSTVRGATFAYGLGRLCVEGALAYRLETLPKSEDLSLYLKDLSLCLKLLALINLKLDSYPVGSEEDFNLRSLVYPTALDRILED